MAASLSDLTWDSLSSAKVYFGSTPIAPRKLNPSKVETKVEKIPRIGEMQARKRSVGRTEPGDMDAEFDLTDWEAFIWPKMPVHGGTLVEFVIAIDIKHPAVGGSYGVFLDRCRIIGYEGPELDASEKGLVMKATISVMERWDKGRDGVLKCANIVPTLPSSQLKALTTF